LLDSLLQEIAATALDMKRQCGEEEKSA